MVQAAGKFLETYRFLHQSSVKNATSIRGLMWVVGKICLFGAVGFCYLIGETYRESGKETIPVINLNGDEESEAKKAKVPLESFNVIVTSNMFGRSKTDGAVRPPVQPTTPMKLRLVAINEISSGNRLAILEDTQKQNQDVFDVNEDVFGQGKVVAILGDSVRIEHGGKIETLTLEDAPSVAGSAPGPAGPASDDQTDFTVAEDELSAALANLPQLLSQARAVPYFRNGQSIGMRLFAIRSGSMYEKLGLKNGDIILSVNENSLSDPAQALKLFEQLKSERSINVKLERNSQNMDMRYNVR